MRQNSPCRAAAFLWDNGAVHFVAMPMTHSAVLLMDLQADFLARDGRLPVDQAEVGRIIATANAVLGGLLLPDALPVLVLNQFPASDRVANFFRHDAAVAGSAGAQLDSRIQARADIATITKASSSAFTNPQLVKLLRAHGVQQLTIFGVFAEGCVRATALDAIRHGYQVTVPDDAIGSNANVKRRFASWAMRRAGVNLVPTLLAGQKTA